MPLIENYRGFEIRDSHMMFGPPGQETRTETNYYASRSGETGRPMFEGDGLENVKRQIDEFIDKPS